MLRLSLLLAVAAVHGFVVPVGLRGTQPGRITHRSEVCAIRCQEGGDAEEVPAADAEPVMSTYEQLTGSVCDFPGCDGNGRAIGGLAAIEMLSWWPIKAYRPCPTCAEAGVKYTRSGQSLDEIVFKKNPKGGYYGDD